MLIKMHILHGYKVQVTFTMILLVLVAYDRFNLIMILQLLQLVLVRMTVAEMGFFTMQFVHMLIKTVPIIKNVILLKPTVGR